MTNENSVTQVFMAFSCIIFMFHRILIEISYGKLPVVSVTPGGGSKRSLEEALLPQQKRQRLDTNGSLDNSDTEAEDFINFDPTELVVNREGTFVNSKSVSTYLSKHCLTKEERKALLMEHPRPDAEVCTVPKVDKYMTEFLGKQLPKDNEAQLTKIQAVILAILSSLAGSP